ncbi:MAG: FG-GAP-like repeat-containing protein [Planctomycetota bacterium]|jgi:hypothetical protein
MIRPRFVVPLFALLLGGCGPVAIALGLDTLFEDDPATDSLQPSVSALNVGDSEAPDYFGAGPLEFTVEANKQVEFEAHLEARGSSLAQVLPTTIERLSATRAAVKIAAGLADGDYKLTATIRDGQGRTATREHEFTIDKRAPQSPVVIEVFADKPRALTVRWVPAFDRDSSDNDDATPSGVEMYRIYFDIGPAEVTSGAVLNVHEYRSPKSSPLEVDGAGSNIVEIPDLAVGRLYRVQVTAVDRAGNESFAGQFEDGSFADLFVQRTRAGGDGDFEAQPIVTLAGAPEIRGLRVTDLQGDGIDDLIVLTVDSVLLYHGNGADRVGDGTFAFAASLDGPAIPVGFSSLEYLHTNNDAARDIVVGDHNGNLLYRWMGQGGGTFGARETIDIGSPSVDLAAGDVEPNDGAGQRPRDELVVATHDEPRLVRFQVNGAAIVSTLDLFPRASHVVLGDFDDDVALDLTVADGGELRSVRGPKYAKQGLFQTSSSAGGLAAGLIVADLDRDSRLDIVASHLDGTVAVVYGAPPLDDGNLPGVPGSQSGLIQFEAPVILTGAASSAQSVVADFDSDGTADVAIASFAAGLAIHYGLRGDDGRPSRVFETTTPIAALGASTSIATGDFNSDGLPDLVLANPAGSVQVLLGSGAGVRGDGTFLQLQPIGVGGSENLFIGGAGELDGDGIIDFYGQIGGAIIETDSVLRVLSGRGEKGQGNALFEFGRTNFVQSGWDQLIAGDFDRDGTPDFCGVNRAHPTPDLRGYIEMHLARGNAFQRTFGMLPLPDIAPTAILATPPPVAADMDLDGVLDLVMARDGRATIVRGPIGKLPGPNKGLLPDLEAEGFAILDEGVLNSENGTTATFDVYGLAVADVFRDGQPDIVGVDLEQGIVRVSAQLSQIVEVPLGPAGGDGMTGLPDATVVSSFGELTPFGAESIDLSLRITPSPTETIGAGATIEVIILTPDFASVGGDVEALDEFLASVQAEFDADELTVDEFGFGTPTKTTLDYLQENFLSEKIVIDVPAGTTGATTFDFDLPAIALNFHLYVVNRTGVSLSVQPGSSELRRASVFFAQAEDTVVPDFDDASAIPPESRLRPLLATDLDLDGDVDVVAMHPTRAKLAVLLRAQVGFEPFGAGSYVIDLATHAFPDGRFVEGPPVSIRSADLNGDGVPDLVGITLLNEVFTFLGEHTNGRATGVLVAKQVAKLEDDFFFSPVNIIHSFAVGDFNGDGVPDLVIGNSGEPLVMLGGGKPTKEQVSEDDLQPQGQERKPPQLPPG